MIKFKITKTKKYFTVLIYSLFIFYANAQHEKLIDSIKSRSELDQRRIVLGYLESQDVSLSKQNKHTEFLNLIENFAKKSNRETLLKEVQFIKYKKKIVFDFPKEDWVNNLNMLIKKYTREKEYLFLAYCYHEKSQIEFRNENYQNAFESDLKCLSTLKKVGYKNVPNIGKILHEIALHYYFFKDYEEVIKLMQISIQFPPFSRGLDMQRYNNLGVSYQKLHEKDSAKYFFSRGLKIAKKYQSATWEGLICANLGNLFYDAKKFDSSFYYFQKNYRKNATEKLHPTIKLNSIIDMGKIYLELDSIPKAVSFLNKAEKLIENLNEKHLGDKQQIENAKLAYFETQIKYLKKIGNFRKALIFKDSIVKIQTDLDKKYNQAIVEISEKQVLISDNEASLIKKEKEQTAQSFFYTRLLLCLVIFVFVGYYFMHRAKLKKRSQTEHLLSQNKIVTLEKQQIRKELEIARKEMQFFVSKISQQNKLVSKLEEGLSQLKEEQSEENGLINESLNKLKNVRIVTNENWIHFQDNFDTIFPDFRYILKKEAPTITTSEMRYLMLTKLQFSHKEMALALGVSSSSMRVTWNRVRKRLNGTLEDTPTSILERVMQNEKELN